MLKTKMIISAIAGATALGLSSMALAHGGSYMSAPMPAASSTESAFYLGASGGYYDSNWGDLIATNVHQAGFLNSSNDGEFAFRLFGGYKFNQFLAAELGWLYGLEQNVSGTTFASPSAPVNGKIDSYAIDLSGKLMAPLADSFGLYAKLGIGYLRTQGSGAGASLRTDNFNVTYGAGAFFEVMPNLVAELSWQRFTGNSHVNSSSAQPDADYYSLGLAYMLPTGF